MGANGILAFTLGLEGGKFLSVANQAEKGLAGITKEAIKLTGVGALVGTAFEGLKQSANIVKGVFDAFQRGADLERLHARTGESVADLFLLQKGFKAVGLEADGVGQMLFHLQKGLTGISDLGEDTTADFAQMGLSMQAVRAMKAPEQFEAIAASLVKMDRATSSAIAGKLFGREGAANFLQLARSGKDFAEAMQSNAAAAAQMESNAAAFEKIEISMAKLKAKGNNFFAGIAEGAAPGIQRVLDMLNKFDLSGLGKKFGDVIAEFSQTIVDHKLGELLKLSLNAGLEGFANYFEAILAGIGASMERIFKNLPSLGRSLSQTIGGAVNAAISGDAADYDQYARGKKSLSNPGAGSGAAFAKAFTDSLAGGNSSASGALAAFLAKELSKVPQALASSVTAPGSSNMQTFGKNFDFTSVERMGFHFNGGGPSVLQDHAARTARATEKIAANTDKLVAAGCMGLGVPSTPFSFSQSTSGR